jgi:hypothetical protein
MNEALESLLAPDNVSATAESFTTQFEHKRNFFNNNELLITPMIEN